MDRKKFIKSCSLTCLGGLSLSSLLTGCISMNEVSAQISGSNLVVPLSHFIQSSKRGKTYKRYIVVSNDQLKYPVCVFRHNEEEYIALLMQCTHQGNELQVFGDRLQCPAHGSEFNRQGEVTQGPAEQTLRRFAITRDQQHLLISLK